MKVNVDNLRQRYNKMETEDLIELRSEGGLSDLASGILDEVLKSRGVTDDRLTESTKEFEGKVRSSEKRMKGARNWLKQKEVLGMPVGVLLNIVLVVFVVRMFTAPVISNSKTNRTYLKSLIDSGTIKETAVALTGVVRKKDGEEGIKNLEWELVETTLTECMLQEAKIYLASRDPFLNERANKQTPTILFKRGNRGVRSFPLTF